MTDRTGVVPVEMVVVVVMRRDMARNRFEFFTAPVLFLSAQGDVISRVDGLTVGGVDFITKPFHVVKGETWHDIRVQNECVYKL